MTANTKTKRLPLSAWLLLGLLSVCAALAAYELWVAPFDFYFNPLYFHNLLVVFFDGALAYIPLIINGVSLIGWFLLLFGVDKGTPLVLFGHVITLLFAVPCLIFGLIMIFVSPEHLVMLVRFVCQLVPTAVACAALALLHNWKDLIK